MKKLLSAILIVISLFLLVGCGSKRIDSGDSESKYPYGWTENNDGTITVKIGGRWNKKCAWKAEYDEEILTCTPDKRGKAFTIGSLDARTGEVDLRLYREGEEMWEYGICIRAQGNGSGGAVVLATTHEEPAFEGSYTVWEMEDNSVLIRIHTEHSWKSRLVSRELSTELTEVDAEGCSFRITAEEPCQGLAELIDEEGSRLLTVRLDTDEEGKLTVSDVEASDDITFGEAQLEAFWQIMGFTMYLGNDVTVKSAKVVNDIDYALLTYGTMDITVADKDYEYTIALDERLLELYGFGAATAAAEVEDGTEIDAEAGAVSYEEGNVPVAMMTADADGVTVNGYVCGSKALAVWEQFGCVSILEGKEDCDSVVTAAMAIMGVTANG